MLVEVYKGWSIYYSSTPRRLWTATKDVRPDLHSYEGIERLMGYIDEAEVQLPEPKTVVYAVFERLGPSPNQLLTVVRRNRVRCTMGIPAKVGYRDTVPCFEHRDRAEAFMRSLKKDCDRLELWLCYAYGELRWGTRMEDYHADYTVDYLEPAVKVASWREIYHR